MHASDSFQTLTKDTISPQHVVQATRRVTPSRVLIVDDDQTCALMIARILRPRGYSIECLFTGQEAIDLRAGSPFDLFICDWILKDGHDGIDVANALCAQCPDLHVIFITGLAVCDLRHASQHLPVVGLFEKPIRIDARFTTIDSLQIDELP